jgi:hypothetical protein
MTTLEDKLREFGSGTGELFAERKPREQHAAGHRVGNHGKPSSRIKRSIRGAAMKYVAAIALVLALIAFVRAGVLECKIMGEALSPRCLLVGASLSWPQTAKNGEGKARRNAAAR